MKKVLFGLFCFLFKILIAIANGGTPLSIETSNEYLIAHSKLNLVEELDSCSIGGTPNFIQTPKLDTIEVLLNGRIFVRIDTNGQGATGFYDFYQNDTSPSNLIVRVPSNQDTITFLSGASISSKDILIEAVDSCDSNNKTLSSVYRTMRLSGFLNDPCQGEYTLNWNAPTGFSNAIAGYRVYADFTGSGYRLVNTINNASATSVEISGISRGIAHKFRVHAFDNHNAVNISAAHTYRAPINLATYKLVPPPTPRCTYVNPNGSVTLSWLPAVDTVNNFSLYNIQYKSASEFSWSEIPGNADDFLDINDKTFTISGISAQAEQYDFRITSMAGCTGRSFLSYQEISSVFLDASQRAGDPIKTVDLSWNETGVNHGLNNPFNVAKSTNGGNHLFVGSSSNSGEYVDDDNKFVCNSNFSYVVSLTDSLFDSQGARCLVRSNFSNLNVSDSLPPKQIEVQLVSYDLDSGGLNVYWKTIDSTDIDSLVFITGAGLNSIARKKYNFNPSYNNDSIFISHRALDARSTSITIASSTFDGCSNASTAPLLWHQTITINVGWLVKDSINKLSWNAYVGFNESFDIEYDVYYANSESGPWLLAGSSGTDRSFEHKIPGGNQMYYYHVKASPIDPAGQANLTSNSNIGMVYSPFVDTTISINESTLEKQLNLYPNPVKEQLILKYSGVESISIQIFNLQGQELAFTINKKKNAHFVNVQSLPKGIYFIKVDDGKFQSSLKFFKE